MDFIDHRRYYGDSYTWRFDANVIETSTDADKPCAILDSTYFYPTSGGQHVLEAPIERGTARAAIHGARRFDHMQQHTGQHILSQAFLRVANAATISFHLGTGIVSIDLDAPKLTDASIDDAVNVTNELIASNVEVRAWFPVESEIASLPLRKMPDVEGPLRVVAIATSTTPRAAARTWLARRKWDCCPCFAPSA